MANGTHFDSEERSFVFVCFLNFLLAIIIFYHAELGRLLGIQTLPLPISVVWPATGFSLAALLIFGNMMWPGIFFGNFAYNLLHIYLGGQATVPVFFTALAISTGSLLQALVGNYLIRRYAKPGFFNTVHDVLIFLVPAGVLTCFIAPTIGVTSLYLYGSITTALIWPTWITFLVGDSMGVYIFTPLLVVWSLAKPLDNMKKYSYEVIWMALGLGFISFLTYTMEYPVKHFYILIGIWSAYRFGSQGAALANFIICLVVIIPTSLGYGLVISPLLGYQLFILVTFLEVVVATSLILAAVVKEREDAWLKVNASNINLQQEVEAKREELKAMNFEMFIKEKLNSLGLLTVGMSRRLHIPFKQFSNLIKLCLDSLNQTRELLSRYKTQIGSEADTQFQHAFENIQNSLLSMENFKVEASMLAQTIEKQAVYMAPEKIKVKSINVNLLVNKCLITSLAEAAVRYPDLKLTVVEEFDREVKMVLAMPEDLAQAFNILIGRSIDSIKAKKEKEKENYTPLFKVKSLSFEDKVEIEIQDNGQGISEREVEDFYSSFLSYKTTSLGEQINISLAFAHDIIIHIYRGELKVSSNIGEYLKVTVVLPREIVQNSIQ